MCPQPMCLQPAVLCESRQPACLSLCSRRLTQSEFSAFAEQANVQEAIAARTSPARRWVGVSTHVSSHGTVTSLCPAAQGEAASGAAGPCPVHALTGRDGAGTLIAGSTCEGSGEGPMRLRGPCIGPSALPVAGPPCPPGSYGTRGREAMTRSRSLRYV